MVASALSQFANTFQTESPMRRILASGCKETFGWVDFWAYYRNTDFFIELKQSYYSLKSDLVNKELTEDWNSVNNQIKSFNNKNVTGYCASDSVVLLSFHVIPLYINTKQDISIREVINSIDLNKIHNKIIKELTPSPSWSYLWDVKADLIENTS